jgi:peroxiredoxin
MRSIDPSRPPVKMFPGSLGCRHGVLLGLLLMTALLVACERGGSAPPPDVPSGTEVGQAPPPLTGRLPSGEEYTHTHGRGERTVVLFYRSETCGLCRLRLEQLQENLSAYRSLRAEVVAVTLDPPELSARTAERLGGDLRIVSVDSTVFAGWDVLEAERRAPLPGAYVLDDRGVVIFRHLGGHAGDRISDATLLTILETAER